VTLRQYWLFLRRRLGATRKDGDLGADEWMLEKHAVRA
jgi:hypothetical protein